MRCSQCGKKTFFDFFVCPACGYKPTQARTNNTAFDGVLRPLPIEATSDVPTPISLYLAQVRKETGYVFLRDVNDLVFWLHCILITSAVLLCLFGLGWSESLGVWSFLFLAVLTAEAVIVALVIRGAAELAVDMADCVAEQTRLASAAHEQATSPTTPSPPPTPPSGS